QRYTDVVADDDATHGLLASASVEAVGDAPVDLQRLAPALRVLERVGQSVQDVLVLRARGQLQGLRHRGGAARQGGGAVEVTSPDLQLGLNLQALGDGDGRRVGQF